MCGKPCRTCEIHVSGKTVEKNREKRKKVLTKGEGFGILTKLSGTRDTEQNTGKQKEMKKFLDSKAEMW